MFCTYNVRNNFNIVSIFNGYCIFLNMILYLCQLVIVFVLTGYSISLKWYSICINWILYMLSKDIVFDFPVYCICLNWIKYFSLLDKVFSLGPAVPLYHISAVLFFTVLYYPCRGVHSRRAPWYSDKLVTVQTRLIKVN